MSYETSSEIGIEVSLLQKASRSHVEWDPCPHIVISNALPNEIFETLSATFPSAEDLGVDSRSNNLRWSTKAKDISRVRNLHPLWKTIVDFHTSQAFLNEVFSVFGEAIVNLYPSRFPTEESLKDVVASVRELSSLSAKGLSLDAQISGNTPVSIATSPRGVHVDAPNALYGGLFYMRDHNDDSVGGDLQFWKWNKNYSFGKKSGEYREGVLPRHITLVKTIPYQSNTLVLFLNSLDSLHSVTVRQRTPHTRKFINLVADASEPFFQLRPSPYLRIRNFVRRRLN